jgi:hypothetical protein
MGEANDQQRDADQGRIEELEARVRELQEWREQVHTLLTILAGAAGSVTRSEGDTH